MAVYAHPEPCSICGAINYVALCISASAAKDLKLSALYAMHWSPVLGENDFVGACVDADYLELAHELVHAFASGSPCAAIRAEQSKVERFLVLNSSSLSRGSMPAIVKGGIHRMFSRGFAYSSGR